MITNHLEQNSHPYSTKLSEQSFAIFLFHGVIDEKRHQIRNYTRKHLTSQEFSCVLQDLVTIGTPVSMTEIARATLSRQALPPYSFAVTFDDGFDNNYSIAAPILRDYGIPATFYVTIDFIENNGWSWVDLIEAAVELSSAAKLKGFAESLDGIYTTIDEKIGLLNRIRKYVKGTSEIDPYQFAERFCQCLGLSISDLEPDRDLDLKMTWERVCHLHADPLFEVGGHGKTHRILSYLNDSELQEEICTSLSKLSTRLDEPIIHYSYPEGLSNCFDERTIRLLKRSGVICCPSAEPGVNQLGDDLFRLKRIMVL